MKNILRRILIIILLLQIIFCIVSVSSEAAFIGSAEEFLKKGKEQAESASESTNDGEVMQIIQEIYSVLLQIGIGATVIVGGVLGIKFMLASAEDKAKVKESMIPYVIGCVVIYGAFGIWKICIQIFSAF